MTGKARLEEMARRHHAGIVLLITQARDCLRAHTLDGIVVEARLRERETEEFEGLVGVLDQRLQRTADGVVAGIERELDRASGKPLLKRIGIVIARAFVEQPAEHLRDAGLVDRVMRGAAFERECDGDERHHVGFDMPRFNSSRRCQRLDHGRGCGSGFDGSCHGTLILKRTLTRQTFAGNRSPTGAE